MTQPLQNLSQEWWLLGEPALGVINMALQLISYDVALFFFFFCNLSPQRKLSGDLCMRFKQEWKEKGVQQNVFPSMASEEEET